MVTPIEIRAGGKEVLCLLTVDMMANAAIRSIDRCIMEWSKSRELVGVGDGVVVPTTCHPETVASCDKGHYTSMQWLAVEG